jgi:hypothetical protein
MAQTGRKLSNNAFAAWGRVAVGVESRPATDELWARSRQVARALNNQKKPESDPNGTCFHPDSRCTRLFGSVSFMVNHQVLYEETDLLLRYGPCSFELLHGHGYGRRYAPVKLTMSCIWAVMLVTKHNLPESERDRSFVVTNPVGKKRSFDKLMDLAQWAAANALSKPESEWLMNGRDVE